ncbi:GNAT family N-acetyltransferase [Dysgonomonas sp. 520]|uniref:GNAT family N-acetyltransferase n=1 Tax=Dysgonomonas sp. 520 TaxID=2302931 RepID=UPI0013D54DB3|nr:GNAT family N-acetyltransferase [Dysgonomonas sp. 520]NDW10431.1 GNAT family N-acetyltransferase [Dysgonomonas sp. 520]
MIEIKPYNTALKEEWDSFVSVSKNGTFLFKRDFMEYHSDRFRDFSLLFYKEGKLLALLPANKVEDVLHTHQGLTYGGFVLSEKCGIIVLMEIFERLISFLKEQGVKKMIYKTVPHIYHRLMSDEDLYVLFRHEAQLIARSISSCVTLPNTVKYSENRRRALKRAVKNNIIVQESDDFSGFWLLLESNLQDRFDVKPVHSLEEIELLKSKFPQNIKLFEAKKDGQVQAGCVVFEMPQIVHVQYISSSENGKMTGALDAVFDYLIGEYYQGKRYFDFGISTEKGGEYLNEGLITQKEGFGGRGIVYDIYEVKIE